MISIGDRRIAAYCEGATTRLPTVILIPTGGGTAKDWATIQPAISKFMRVCSYDHANANNGQSDKPPFKLASVDQAVDDLHGWLTASGEKGPFVLVGHSIAGFYVRRFVTSYPHEVTGLVFVDSSHEEQALRLHEIDPEGPGFNETDIIITEQIGFYVKPGQRLEWRTALPLIVLGKGVFPRRA
jgi:pimeloyl-ACP methyl ester carboxylesterase